MAYKTREEWLNALNDKLDELFAKAGKKHRPKMMVTCGFPSVRARINPNGKYRIGECWDAEAADDNQTHHILISPTVGDVYRVAEVLIHERSHAYLPKGTGHRAPFARLAKAVGLEGKPTSTELSDELRDWLTPILEELGPYPHVALDTGGVKKQGTRLILLTCPQCGMKMRTTNSWIVSVGAPYCRCGGEFEVGSFDDDVISLKMTEQMSTFETDDPRFEVRFIKSKSGRDKDGRWYIVDHEAPGPLKPRLTTCTDRQECIDTIDAIIEGLFPYPDIEENIDHYDPDVTEVPEDEYEVLDYPEEDDGSDEYPEATEVEPPSIINDRGDFDLGQSMRRWAAHLRDRRAMRAVEYTDHKALD